MDEGRCGADEEIFEDELADGSVFAGIFGLRSGNGFDDDQKIFRARASGLVRVGVQNLRRFGSTCLLFGK